MNTAQLKNDPRWPTLIVTALDSMARLDVMGDELFVELAGGEPDQILAVCETAAVVALVERMAGGGEAAQEHGLKRGLEYWDQLARHGDDRGLECAVSLSGDLAEFVTVLDDPSELEA